MTQFKLYPYLTSLLCQHHFPGKNQSNSSQISAEFLSKTSGIPAFYCFTYDGNWSFPDHSTFKVTLKSKTIQTPFKLQC